MRNKIKHFRWTSAFTYVELIVYVALVSIITVSLMTFVIQILVARNDSNSQREVIENTRFVMGRITDELRRAQTVNTGTGTFGVNPGSVEVNNGSGTVVIGTDTKVVAVGGSGYVVRYVYIDRFSEGPVQLTSDSVNVSNFVLSNFTQTTEPPNIGIQLTLDTLTGDSSMSTRSAVSLRQ